MELSMKQLFSVLQKVKVSDVPLCHQLTEIVSKKPTSLSKFTAPLVNTDIRQVSVSHCFFIVKL